MYALQPMWTVAINWVIIVLNGNCHIFSEACIRACVIFRTSIYVKIFRAGWHCFSVACEGEISNGTNREVFFYWPASGWSLFGRPLKKVGLAIWKSIPVNKLDLIKVHLTPNFFLAQINFHIMWSKSPQKFFDLLESSIFYRWSKYGKFNKNAAILVHVRVLGAWD